MTSAAEARFPVWCAAMSEELSRLLVGTSRTFAAAIPLLESPLAEQVTVAYLLLRIADTFEDADAWPAKRRIEALAAFEGAIAQLSCPPLPAPLGFDAAHEELMAKAPRVVSGLAAFTTDARAVIAYHVTRTSVGMREFLVASAAERGVELRTIDELFRYCYVVAGIVGELLTELFIIAVPFLAKVERELRADAAAFGEALQLVNILKDRERDAAEGRRFIPQDADLSAVLARARADCERARRYTRTLEVGGASPGILAFTRFPLRVAEETLSALETTGAGAKIGRSRVLTILDEERKRR